MAGIEFALGVAGDAVVEVVGVAGHLHQATGLHLAQLLPAQQALAGQPVVAEAHLAGGGFQPAAHHRHHRRGVVTAQQREGRAVHALVAVVEAEQQRLGGQAGAAATGGEHLIDADEVVAVGGEPVELGREGLRGDGVVGQHGPLGALDLVVREHHQLTARIARRSARHRGGDRPRQGHHQREAGEGQQKPAPQHRCLETQESSLAVWPPLGKTSARSREARRSPTAHLQLGRLSRPSAASYSKSSP